MSDETPSLHLTFNHDDAATHLKKEWCNEEAVAAHGSEECDSQFDRLLAWLGTPPMFTTLRVNTRLHSPEKCQEQLTAELEKQYKERSNEPAKCKQHAIMNDMMIIPNYGPHQLSEEEKEVVVGLACGMAVLRGADVYAQGIMAAPTHMVQGDSVSVFADVEGAVRKGLAKKFTGKRLFVGNGVVVMGRSQIFCAGDKPSGLAIQMTCPLYTAPSLAGLLPHLVFPQNLPSAVCSHVLDPRPGEHILDMCAAPGGKTTHIATLMNNEGQVVALDKSKGKIKTIQNNAATWGLSCIHAYHFDGTKALDETIETPDPLGSPPFGPRIFDRVLLDAPCSALGQRPAVQNAMKLNEVTSYPPLQRKLFTAAVGLLRPGGVLVYSTCTWTLEENEGLVAWALKTFPEMSLVPQTPHLGGRGREGRGLTADQLKLLQRFGPPPHGDATLSADSDTIGFFCAKFVKAKS